jgi:DNA polymerase IV
MERTILHIDMDAFFAAIEVLDHPEFKGKPVIVGGATNRGVVSTANYEARKFGIHSAMPIFQAREKCPGAVFLPVNMPRYKEISEDIMKILEDFTPLVEPVSIDEAFLDIMGMEDLLGNPEQIARQIKDRIYNKTSLTCSIGIAPNKFLAKVASDLHKPDGLTIIQADEVDSFLATLPVEKIPGVGKRTVEALKRHGIKTAGEIKLFSEDQLVKRFGKFGLRLHELSHGHDSSPVVPSREMKSISAEETLSYDTNDLNLLSNKLKGFAEKVAERLRYHGRKGRAISLKIKFSDFTAVTKAKTISHATDTSQVILLTARRLLKDQPLPKKVRLIGLEVSNLSDSEGEAQMDLFPVSTDEEREGKIDKAMDEIRGKFGRKVITRGDG